MKNKSLYNLIQEISLSYPNDIAYSYYGSKVNYKTFLNKIDEYASAFKKYGVKKGDYVSIIMFKTEEVLILLYALNKLGAICNMLNPLYSEEELKYSLNITNSKIVILSDYSYKKLNNIKKETNVNLILKIEDNSPLSKINKLKDKLLNNSPKEDFVSLNKFISNYKTKEDIKDIYNEEAVVLYRGTLYGKLQGMVLTNESINNSVINLNERLNNLDNSKILNLLPIFTGFGISFSHFIHLNHQEEIIIDINDLKRIDSLIISSKPNIIFSNPNLINNFINGRKLRDKDLSFVERIICTSQVMNKTLNNFLYDHNSSTLVDNMYGCSELTSGVSLTLNENEKIGSVGLPLINNSIIIIDSKNNKVLKNNKTGIICVSSNSLMKEYLFDKEETKKKIFVNDNKKYFITGDIGYLDDDGYLYFESKMDDVIESDGYKIYRSQIEETILKHPYVEKCVVVALPHPYKKEVVKAYIVLKKGYILNSEIKKNIRSYCEKNIASYALPYAYGYRKEIPQNILGKISYRELIVDNDEEV